MHKITSRIKRSVRNRFKNSSVRTSDDLEPSTTPSLRETPSTPAIAANRSQLPPEQNTLNHPLSTASTVHLEPDHVTQPPAASITSPQTEQDTTRDAWLGLKTLARVIREGGGHFAPLKEAIGGISEVISTFELAAQNREDYQKLMTELDALLHDLAGYLGSSTPPAMTSSIVNLAQGIERELQIVRRKQHQSGVGGYVKAETDADQILQHYRSIEGLLRRLMLNANMDMWRAVSQQAIATGEQVVIVSEQAIENRLSKLPNSPAARYRSAKSSTVLRGECTPNTRVKVLQDLDQWACDSESQKVYWLNGMAGTGKTTIAYSFCRRLEHSSQLAASFFCSRQLQGCHDVDQIVPTISYQLSRFSHPFRTALSRVLENDSDVHNQPLLDQFRQLIVQPMTECKDALPTILVVAVDALDECEGSRGAEFIEALLMYARDLPVKFFVTSRPDARILDSMRGQEADHTSAELRLHDLDRSIVEEDIRTYLLIKIPSRVRLSVVDLDTLVERSGVLFIYAATVVRYIESDNFAWAKKRLQEVLASGSGGSASNSDRDIDALYNTILAAAFENPSRTESDRADMTQVLHTAVCAQEPLSINTMAGLLRLDSETVHAALRPLLSVLYVSDAAKIITTLHKSFSDYLLHESRSGALYCNVKEHNAYLTRICFDQINMPEPAFNICGLDSSYVLDRDVPDLASRVERAVSTELRYACRYWGVHTMLAKDSENLASMLLRFLSDRFLLWLEVVNLCKYVYDGVRMLYRMQKWALNTRPLDENTQQLLRDAWMFAASFASSPARLSTPHIYVSALTFWPEQSPMGRLYQKNRSRLTTSASTAMNLRSVVPLSIQNTQSEIFGLSYSPDGAYIVSGCANNTIRIWDAHTGQPVGQPLQGHTNSVRSVAYSPDGAYIVSGSSDKTIRIWDAHTHQQVGKPLQGHTGYVSSVAYSPDGAYIVSGSYDNTIRIWDTQTDQSVGQTLQGHTRSVWSVAYSPDGAYIVSGSWDNTIRIWDAYTRQQVGQPLQGHTSSVKSVAYSPDGAYIVSGSDDRTIHIWDARIHQQVGQPLQGHTGYINSVAYSPDGAYIVSGSDDHTIGIWDAHTRRQVGQPLQGHTSSVSSVAYSPDGAYLVSGSDDCTIRIWDAQTIQSVGQTLEGHTDCVFSVAYSPDGAYIVSGSYDNTIRIWDTQTIQSVGQPLEGHNSFVMSVSYSPDGAYIVSGSYDQTIRIWDAHTCQPVGQPLQGHTNYVMSVAYSPDGAYIVSGSHDSTIRIWDAHAHQQVGQPLEGHTGSVRSVSYSPDGAYIVSGSGDNTIRIWDANTHQQVGQPLQGHTDYVRSVAYSPDGAYLVSRSDYNTIRIWDAHTRRQVGQPLQGHTSSVKSVAYSPDGAYIVSGSDDRTIRIWDTLTGQQVGQSSQGHTIGVWSVAYSPDGAYIVSGSEDKTIRIWDTQLVIPIGAVQQPHHSSQIALPSSATPKVNLTQSRRLCNLGCLVNCPHMAWTLNEDGWIVFNDCKLIWVPPDLRITLVYPQCTGLIHRRGFLHLDLDRNKLGENWCESFRPRKS
ncbi:hypothetical protein FRC09_003525 [Ceratobasidium sp. 395]|nr:hypothetical protein FRC09_003525 [Ceratobasidium sp. 395]